MCGLIVYCVLLYVAGVGIFSAISLLLGSVYEVYEAVGILGLLALIAFIFFCVWLVSKSNDKDGKK